MRKFSTAPVKQAGFTLIELVIVIVIIGILAAVAVPKLTSVSDAANKAANKAILGMTKSAWSAAYAVARAVPTVSQVADQTGDPACTAVGGGLSCPAAWTSPNGTGPLLINYNSSASSPITSLVCNTAADCD